MNLSDLTPEQMEKPRRARPWRISVCSRVDTPAADSTGTGALMRRRLAMGKVVRLYHGSDAVIERPDISFNTGFADLGRGFYLTDDHEAARSRAYLRSRRMGAESGVISIFDLDVSCVRWTKWGGEAPALADGEGGAAFGLSFEESREGIVAWANYIKACRQGKTGIPGLGEPSMVRAWIATEEVEMVCSEFATAEEVAQILVPAALTVQFCLRDQALIDRALTFVSAERLLFR